MVKLFYQKWLPIVLTLLAFLSMLLVVCNVIKISLETKQLRSVPLVDLTEKHPHQMLAAQHLFGLYDDSDQLTAVSQLTLSLQGTIMNSDNPKLSLAIISAAQQPPKLYRIADALPGGAVINKITRNQVLINEGGQLRSLRLPAEKL